MRLVYLRFPFSSRPETAESPNASRMDGKEVKIMRKRIMENVNVRAEKSIGSVVNDD